MSKNADYKIKNVTVSTNGRNEIYFDIEWDGDENLDYLELRIREGGTDNSLELYAYPAHQQRIVVKDFDFVKSWKSKQVNNETFYVELGIADYTEKGELKSWEILADYEPIEVGIYYEPHIFRKNVLELRYTTMSTNSEYKINKVAISGNGINELYLDIEWGGDNYLDYYELRVLDRNKEYVESCAFAAHNHRIVIKDYLLGIKNKELRSETFHIELGIPEYTDEGKELSWKVLASYEPIFVNIYHEYHMFHKNVLEIREPKKDSPRRKSEEYREAYLNACRVIVAGSRSFFEYDLMSRELDKLFNESKEFTGRNIKIVSGMADDADTLAIRYADEHQLTKILFPANWKSYKRIAGFLRNEDMLSVATHLVVFWDGKSSGTRHMIEIAKAKGIPIWGVKHPCIACFGDLHLERWN